MSATDSQRTTADAPSATEAQTETDLLSLHRQRFKDWTERTTRRDTALRWYARHNSNGPEAA